MGVMVRCCKGHGAKEGDIEFKIEGCSASLMSVASLGTEGWNGEFPTKETCVRISLRACDNRRLGL